MRPISVNQDQSIRRVTPASCGRRRRARAPFLQFVADWQEFLLCSLVAFFLLLPASGKAQAATYVDPQNLIALTVTPAPSAASGHLAWRFEVAPVTATHEVSSIDAATGGFGFFGESFRQVNPNGLSTVFADFNSFFDTGEDETTDTQFAFARANLTVVPGSELEDGAALEAAFTGFDAIRDNSPSNLFAQVVMPTSGFGSFHGAFVLRPIAGGLGQLVEIGPIAFNVTPGDFDFDGDVDGADFLTWQHGEARDPLNSEDLLEWQANYVATESLAATYAVPEPSGLVLLLLVAGAWWWGRTRFPLARSALSELHSAGASRLNGLPRRRS